MIEKVTFAIMRAFFSRPVEEQTFNASPVDNEDLARAAIEAMRVPTPEMLKAFYRDTHVEQWLGEVQQDWRAMHYWQAMIDAALKE